MHTNYTSYPHRHSSWRVFFAPVLVTWALIWAQYATQVTTSIAPVHSALHDCKPMMSSAARRFSSTALARHGSDDDGAVSPEDAVLPECPLQQYGCCTKNWDQLLFLHIPKSGGTAVYYALWDSFLSLGKTTVRGEIKPCINRATAHIKNRLQLDHMCRSKEAVSRTVCMLNEVFPQHCRFLRLHFDFSVVTEVLAVNTTKRMGLLTVMRQPADRVNSAYRFAEDFIYGKAGPKENHFGGANHATKQMAGVLDECSQLSPARKAELLANETQLLELAKRNLEHFCVVIYEYMEESLEYLRLVYGLRNLALRPLKYNAGDHRAVPFDDHKMIMEANALDAQLYNHSLMLFAQRYHAVTGKQLPPYPHKSAEVAAYSPYNVTVTTANDSGTKDTSKSDTSKGVVRNVFQLWLSRRRKP
eukprot:jgi/Mesvir1/7848/Mv11782-RA.1